MLIVNFIKMYLANNYAIINFLILLKLFYISANDLQWCNFDVPKVKTSTECTVIRQWQEYKTHKHVLINANEKKISFSLTCPLCPLESVDQFKWVYVDAKTTNIILHGVYNIFIGHYVDIWRADLKDVKGRLSTDLCVTKHDLQLIGRNVDVNRYSGTYICVFRRHNYHSANHIYHHVYRIESFKSRSLHHRVPYVSFYLNRVYNRRGINAVKDKVDTNLKRVKELQNQNYTWSIITYKEHIEGGNIRQCGRQWIHYYRRCYQNISQHMLSQRCRGCLMDSVKVYTLPFMRLATLYNIGLEGAKQLAMKEAKRLGFHLYADNGYFLVPCEYELIQHLNVDYVKNPPPGRHVSVFYELMCARFDVKRFENITGEKYHIYQMKPTVISTIQHDIFYYKEMQNIFFMEYEKHVVLKCDFDKIKQLDPELQNYGLYWKSSNEKFQQKMKRNRQNSKCQAANKCDVIFQLLQRNDVGTYYCKSKNLDLTITHFNKTKYLLKWNDAQIVTYNLYVKRVNYSWSQQNTIINGIIVLNVWSFLLIIIWITFLCCINYAKKIQSDYYFETVYMNESILPKSKYFEECLQGINNKKNFKRNTIFFI
ncbi:unnamed protein product [Schistosoma turkestanicum]|nr:unnamed protein product [Schistosoma turkestanicum]